MSTTSNFATWIRSPRPNPQARLRLFCFAYAGGGAALFHSWWRTLPAEVEVCPIELPGRGGRIMQPPFTDMGSLIEALVQGIQSYLTLPCAFFGYSMGSLISFELAQHLAQPHIPVHLLVAAYRAPHIPHPYQSAGNLSDSEFIENLRLFNGTPLEVLENRELMELLLPTLRADFKLCETYINTHKKPLACPITVFGGRQDERVNWNDLEAWKQWTSASFAVHTFEGDHFFLFNSREQLLKVLSQILLKYPESIYL